MFNYEIGDLVKPVADVMGGEVGEIYNISLGNHLEPVYFVAWWYTVEEQAPMQSSEEDGIPKFFTKGKAILTEDKIVGKVKEEEFEGWPNLPSRVVNFPKSPTYRMKSMLRKSAPFDTITPGGKKLRAIRNEYDRIVGFEEIYRGGKVDMEGYKQLWSK